MKRDCRFRPRLLWEYEEGLLDERRRAEVEHHLSECEACRAHASSDRELFAKLRNQRPLAAPETARPPRWEAQPAAGPAVRWRWPVTVVGVAVLAFVAFGVFRLAEDRSYLFSGDALERDATPGLHEKAQTAPEPTDEGTLAEAQGSDQDAPVHGSAEPLRKSELTDRPAQPALGPKVTSQRHVELPEPKPTQRSEAGGGTETRLSFPDTAGKPPKEELGGAGPMGGHRAGAGGGLGTAADNAPTRAVVTALTDDGTVLAVAEMDASDRVSIREQDGTKLSFELGDEQKWPGRPAYLDRLITLSETGSLGVLSKRISDQAAVPVEVEGSAQSRVVTVQLSEVQLGLALANIALATETEWKATKDRVVISPLRTDAATAKAGRGGMEPKQRPRALTQQMREGKLIMQQSSRPMDTVCPWCGRPHFGPLWRYCPFCGQPLQGKP